MQLATFRTEYAFDGDRARSLVDAMGLVIVKDYILGDKDRSHVSVHVFTIEVPDGVSVSEIKEKMGTFVEYDPRFAYLHRCEQTLQEGEDYKDLWYDKAETAPVPALIEPLPLQLLNEGLFIQAVNSPYGFNKPNTPAELTAHSIMLELGSRSGIGDALDSTDEQTQDELADSIASIIETMYPPVTATPDMTFFNRVRHEVNS